MRKIKGVNEITLKQRLKSYRRDPLSVVILALVWGAMLVTASSLLFILWHVISNGLPNITPELFSLTYTSENSSVFPAIVTTLYMTFISLIIAAPLGIACAVWLVEYAKKGSRFLRIIGLATETLAGIPSIIYGLFGYLFFVIALRWSYTLMAGACTLAIMILPIIIRATEEALRSVPDTFREASFGLGAGRLRTVFRIVLPSAIPGILAGIILSIGRIVGETAALIFTAGTVAKIPATPFESGRTLAIHMYLLSSEGLHTGAAYATGVILLITVFVINSLSSYAAKKMTKG